jgi:hypothetical protein
VPDLVQELIVACNGKEITSIYYYVVNFWLLCPTFRFPHPPSPLFVNVQNYRSAMGVAVNRLKTGFYVRLTG